MPGEAETPEQTYPGKLFFPCPEEAKILALQLASLSAALSSSPVAARSEIYSLLFFHFPFFLPHRIVSMPV